jgi:hypothetical protein
VRIMGTILQIAGALAITAGACIISLPVGIIVGGVFAIVIGIAIGR